MKQLGQLIVKGGVAGLLYLMAQSSAWATISNCTTYGDGTGSRTLGDPPRHVVVPIAGEIYLGNEADANTISAIHTVAAYPAYTGFTGFYCKRTDPNDFSQITLTRRSKIDHLVAPMGGPMSLVLTGFNTKVYPTNIPGIGVSFEYAPGNTTAKEYMPLDYSATANACIGQRGHCSYGYRESSITVSFRKIGDTPTGAYFIDATSFPTFSISDGTAEYPPLDHYLTVSFSGGLTVTNRTCDVQNVTVDLGEHEKSYFQSNDGSPWVDFNVELTNCPAFKGSGGVTQWYDTQPSREATRRANKMTIMLKPTTTILNSWISTVALDNESGAAEGVGIQVSYNDGVQATYNRNLSFTGLTTPGNIDGMSYNIPFKARYYKLGNVSDIKPGVANTSMEFIISYK